MRVHMHATLSMTHNHACCTLAQVLRRRYTPMPDSKQPPRAHAEWGPRAAAADVQGALLGVLTGAGTTDLRATWLHVRDVLLWAKAACAKGGFAHASMRNWRRAAHWWLHALILNPELPVPADLVKGHDEALLEALSRKCKVYNKKHDALASLRKTNAARGKQDDVVALDKKIADHKGKPPWCCPLAADTFASSAAANAAFEAASTAEHVVAPAAADSDADSVER